MCMSLLPSILNSYSQVFLQENALMGALIIIGLGIASPLALLFSFIGSITSLIVASMMGIQNNIINSGAFGFNGVLIGVVTALYIKQIPLALVMTILGAILGILLFQILTKNNIPAFTAPFVIIGWIIVFALRFIK